MPNRIIHESAFTSEKIAALTDFEFRLWVGLITLADDLGHGDARPAILRGRLFALREKVTAKEIQSALRTLVDVGCITLYTVQGQSYYAFPHWAEHQRIRNVRPKCPEPEEEVSAAPCGELPQTAADSGEVRPESESESESNPNTKQNPNPNPNPNAKTEPNPNAPALLRPGAPLSAAMDDFAAARRAAKKPLTPKARELTLRELERLAPGDEKTQIAILHQSIQRGWQGVFPLGEARDRGGGNVFFDIAREEGLL